MPDAERQCQRCHKTLSGSGRRSASGLYWCRNKKCQAARARYNYEQANAVTLEADAPTTCANPACNAPLTPRKVRAGDSPLGRWCNRLPCRRHRQASLANPLGVANATELANAIEVLSRVLVWGRYKCPECERDDAALGYVHPDLDGGRCYALGRTGMNMAAAKALWPNELGAPEGCSPEDYARLVPATETL